MATNPFHPIHLFLILCCSLLSPIGATSRAANANANANDRLPHYDYGFSPCLTKPENSTYHLIPGGLGSGGSGTEGSLPVRLEIRRLQQDKELWTLYILGLDMMQYYNQTELISWFQISGQ
jgi:hypothetical protein